MSFLGIHILSDAAVAHLKAAGHEVAAVAFSNAQRAAAALKTTTVGTAVASEVSILAGKTGLTGAQKFEAALQTALPLIVKLLADGGVKAELHEVEDIGRELVQSTYNDVKSTTAGSVATAILSLLKLI